MTTTETTTRPAPVVDRLFALVAHLAKVNQSDLAEHFANIRHTGAGLSIQFHSAVGRDAMLRTAATLRDCKIICQFFEADAKYGPASFHLHVHGLIAMMPIEVWCGVNADKGATEESVERAAQRDLDALVGDSRVG